MNFIDVLQDTVNRMPADNNDTVGDDLLKPDGSPVEDIMPIDMMPVDEDIQFTTPTRSSCKRSFSDLVPPPIPRDPIVPLSQYTNILDDRLK